MPEAGRTAARFDKRGVALCAIAGALLLTAGAAWAVSSHDPWKLREARIDGVPVADAMGQCENCHTLDVTAGEPNTSYVDRNARTLPQMRAFGGVPVSFGCTFCHSDVSDNVYMQNAMKDYEFTPAARKHPVGVNVSGVNNTNEYFSTFDSTTKVDQLDCMDCHDAALLNPGGMGSYPYHEGRTSDAAPWTGTWNKAANPYALKNVAALGDERQNHCVSTCHGDLGAGNGATKPRMGHLGWGAYDGTTMYEPRGQALLQSNCGVCHDAHSSTEDRLMSDGLAMQTTGVNTPPALPDLLKTAETAVDMNDCTLTCHVGRNPASEFRTVGHGKARNREDTANIGHSYTLCTPCHTSSVPHRDPVNPRRFSFTEDTAPAGLTHDGSANNLDDDYDGQVDEADEATWVYRQLSICQGCHSNYFGHGRVNGSLPPGFGTTSCLDCHDPHGKGVGANIEMIRTTIGPGAGEPTTFQNTADMAGDDDFYKGATDDTGVCDNTSCHGRDLATILADPTINDHVGVQPGANCAGCHTHTSPNGGASFKPQCDICHGNPPVNGGLPDYSQGIGIHQRHNTDLGIGCNECHFRDGAAGNVHNEAAWSEPTGIPVPRTHVDVVFNTHGGTVNVNATYSGYSGGNMDSTIGAVHTCTNVTCHNPDSNAAGTGLTGKAGAATNNVVSWADAFTTINACTGCHVQSPITNPDGGSHYKHDNSTGGKGFPCQMCHSAYYDATDTFATAAGAHGNWALNSTGVVNISGTLGAQAIGGTFDDGTNVCSNVYCHGTTLGAGADQPTPVWGLTGAGSGGLCGDCHDTDPGTDVTAPSATISTGNHTAHLGAPQGPNVTCAACHTAYALNAANHVDGEKDFLNLDDTTVANFAATDACNNCHGNSATDAKDATNWATGTFRLDCLDCHDGTARSARTGGVVAPQENLYWATTGHGRNTAYNATLHGQPGPGYLCTVCHNEDAPHITGTLGDSERFRPVADDAVDYTSDTSEVCLDCHKVGQSSAPSPPNHLGRDAQAEASVHSGAVTGNYNTAVKAGVAFPAYGNAAGYAANPGYQCEACHNPHGTTKLAMVKDTLNGLLGSPADSNPVAVGAAFDSSSATLAGLDPTLGANDGACDACHRSSVNTNAHPDSSKANNHNYGQNCVSCHDHKESFYAGCADCHGGNMVGTNRSNYWPDDAVAPDTAGAHAGHVADLAMRLYGQTFGQLLNDPASDAKQKHICKYCHGLNPGNDADHGVTANLPAEVSANQGRVWDTADPPTLTDAVTYNAPAGTRTCQTSECHYNTTTPGWLSGAAATCTTCHNNGTNNGALANSWPDVGTAGTGDHFAHFAALSAEFVAVYGANSVCLACHNAQQPATDFSNIVSLASHIDGDRFGDVTIPAAYNDKSEAAADVVGYTAGVTPNENDGTCANVSCHGGSTIGATPAWRDGQVSTATVTTAECVKCHQRVNGATNPLGTEYNDARSGAHIDHDHGCQACHSAVPTTHYAGIATSALDNPDNIANVTYSVEYTDSTTAAVNPLTNGYFNDATTALGVSGTCATVTCHAGASPAWDVDLTATCGLCHLDAPTSNSHPAHVYNGATPDHTDCDQCHTSAAYAVAATGTDTSFISPGLHADGTVNLAAGIGAAGTGGAVTCAAACHARETTTTWDNTAVAMTCNSCHYYAVAPAAAGNVGIAALGGTHNAHFFGAPANIVCTDCHADNAADVNDKRTHMRNTGATDAAVLQNKAAATQDEADVTAAALGTGTDPDMAPIGPDPTSNPTCTAALCHNPSPAAAYSATWNGLPNNSCGFCHADTSGDPATGSHTKHISYASGYAPCTQCHVDNGATYAHMTRQVELTAGLALGYTAALTPPYTNATWGSCDAGACHDTDTNPAWDTAVAANNCGVCHVNNNTTPASSSDSPNFAGNDRVASQVGIGDEWTLRGHAARGLTCASCHDGAAPHQPDFGTSANPFRLAGYGGSIDAFCSNTTTCHTGATVPGSNLVVSHTNELMNLDQRTWPAWDPKCVDCHDPHGDAANLKMVATDVFDRGSSAHGVPTATLNAIPRTTDVVDFTVQGGIAAGSYGDTTAGADGICQECHLANDGVATNVASFRDDNVVALAGNHPTTSLSPCTQCHKHDKAFEPAGCYGCHGEAVAKQYWPDGAGGSPAYVDDSAGAHDNHVLAISQYLGYGDIATLLAAADTDVKQKTICAFCHPDPGGNGHTVNNGTGDHANTVDVWFDGMNNAGGAGNNFKAFKVGVGAYGDDAAAQATYSNAAAAKTCSNVDCHNEYVTPAGWNTPPDWSAVTPDSRCSNFSCHAAGSYSVSHVAHVADKLAADAGNEYLCTECHVNNGVNYLHENGEVDMLFTAAGTIDVQFGGATAGYYDKDNGGTNSAGDTGFAYKNGQYARSCYNLYCHGDDSTWGGADTTPVWNDPNTATCYGASTCHNAYGSPYDEGGTARNAITSGSHEVHMTQWTSVAGVEAPNPVGPRMEPMPNSFGGTSQHNCNVCHNLSQGVCTECHGGFGASTPTLTHADGRVDFAGAMTGPSPFTVAAVDLASTNACDECHGGAAPAATAKANWSSGAALACESCHGDGAVARSRRNVGWPAEASVNAPVRAGVAFDGSGHGKVTDNVTYGGSACVDCHNEASQHFTQRTNTIAPALGDTNRLDVLGGSDYGTVPTAFCGTCHSGAVETVHYTNLQTGGGTSDDGNQCAICHDPHGQSGQDAMVNGTIAGRTVSGFADKTLPGSYFNAANEGVCQVCHDPAEVQFHNRTSGAGSTHSPNEVCTTCHTHDAAVAFAPRSCESCHNGAAPYVKGSATAPNVMGNGTSATGTGAPTPKPYDDGSYGFNVNGHGRDDTPSVPGNSINVACTACHDINVPTGTHLDGVVNGRLTPSDTRTANSFHLLSAFVKASPTSEQDVQVTFDNACYLTCHNGPTSNMRHALDLVPAANAVQFGTHNTYDEPQNAPPPTMYYDKHLKTNAGYDGLPNFALCVSCHNPHGTDTTSPRADLNNKMMLYRWSGPSTLCVKCHL